MVMTDGLFMEVIFIIIQRRPNSGDPVLGDMLPPRTLTTLLIEGLWKLIGTHIKYRVFRLKESQGQTGKAYGFTSQIKARQVPCSIA
jgi:hypothetical protein